MEKIAKKQALVLTILMLVKKILSILYKIPYQNETGDAGFHVFQQVYPLIAFLMILTGFALPTVMGTLLAKHHYNHAIKDKLKRLMWIFSLVIFASLFLANRQIAILMGDILLAGPLRIVGIHFLFLPPIAYLRSVLQTRGETIAKLGISIVIEQLTRVISIFIALRVFNVNYIGYYQMAEFALLFSLISPVAVLVYLYLLKPDDEIRSHRPITEKPQIIQPIIYLVLGSGILVIFSMIDSFLVFNMLVTIELDESPMVLRGIVERGFPIVQAGTFFVSSIVAMTMNNLATKEDKKERRTVFQTGLILIFGLAIPATFGLMRVMPYLNASLFMDQSGNSVLSLMMLQVVLYATIVYLTAYLTEEKKQSFVMAALLSGTLLKLALTAPLVSRWDIFGAALSTILGLLLICIILIIGSKPLFSIKLVAIVVGIFSSTLLMTLTLNLLDRYFINLYDEQRSGYLLILAANIISGILLYALMFAIVVVAFKIVSKIMVLRYKKKKKREQRIKFLRQQREDEYRQAAEEIRQEELRREEEFLKKQRYRESLMQNKPKKPPQNAQPATVNEQMEGRGHYQPVANYENEIINQNMKGEKLMRLDKFLKVSRIIKRRQTAKEVSDAGKISVNGKIAKSSTPVQIGDEIALYYATRTLTVRILEIKDSTKKEDAMRMYEIIKEELRESAQEF